MSQQATPRVTHRAKTINQKNLVRGHGKQRPVLETDAAIDWSKWQLVCTTTDRLQHCPVRLFEPMAIETDPNPHRKWLSLTCHRLHLKTFLVCADTFLLHWPRGQPVQQFRTLWTVPSPTRPTSVADNLWDVVETVAPKKSIRSTTIPRSTVESDSDDEDEADDVDDEEESEDPPSSEEVLVSEDDRLDEESDSGESDMD